MDERDDLVELFEASRPRLRAVAYRMLGSHAEADDAVQETWLRLARSDTHTIDNLGGWLTTVIARICLDRLRSRRRGAEEPLGARAQRAAVETSADYSPEEQALMADSVGAALLVVLDLLPPAERVAFVLHDVFGMPFDEIAPIVGRTPDAARQLASRGRRRVRGRDETASIDLVQHRTVVTAFLRAAQGGDFDTLVRLLDPDVVLQPDEAALAMGSLAATRGAEAVAGALSGGARAAKVAVVEGLTALVWAPGTGPVRGVINFVIDDGRIVALEVTADAERIAQLDILVLDA